MRIFYAALCLVVLRASAQEDSAGATTTAAATTGGSTTEEPASGLESATCVFGCLESFQRKGVQSDDEDDGSTSGGLDLESGSVCDKLDLEGMERMCGSYLKAGVCLGACVNTPTKKIITGGLDYICVHRLEDYKKYMPCYKKQCPLMEKTCGAPCGMDLSQAQDKWMTQLGVNGTTSAETDSTTTKSSQRRKRRQSDPDTTTESETTTTPNSSEAAGDEEAEPLDTCQFVRCYMNCSRPIMEPECGKDAMDLLRTTSNILLSFVMAPLEEAWGDEEEGPSKNKTFSSMMITCDGYFSQALTDEGIDRSVLASSTTRSIAWSVSLISVIALFILRL